MGKGKNWTKKEELWLAENWGTVSLEGICNHLGRSLNAIKVRVSRMGLPPYLQSGEYVTMHQLILALGKYADVEEARDAFCDLFSALGGGASYYEMPDSVLFHGQREKKDARTKRRGGS